MIRIVILLLLMMSSAQAAYYAQLDVSNVVVRVVVIDDSIEQGMESQGISWCQNFFGGGVWLKTTPDRSLRKNYAGPGYSYRSDIDAFVPPSPYPSWVLNLSTAQWQSPVAYPNDGKIYSWNETTQAWQLSPIE
jgi:hypothetical protein